MEEQKTTKSEKKTDCDSEVNERRQASKQTMIEWHTQRLLRDAIRSMQLLYQSMNSRIVRICV